MIILYSYPELFGLPDNNPFGLKVDTFLRLTHINYQQEHIVNIQNAPEDNSPTWMMRDKSLRTVIICCIISSKNMLTSILS